MSETTDVISCDSFVISLQNHIENTEYDKAVEVGLEGLKCYPTHIELCCYVCYVYIQTHRFQLLILLVHRLGLYKEGTSLSSCTNLDLILRLFIGYAYYMINSDVKALKSLPVVEDDSIFNPPVRLGIRHLKAQIYYRQGLYKEARDIYETTAKDHYHVPLSYIDVQKISEKNTGSICDQPEDLQPEMISLKINQIASNVSYLLSQSGNCHDWDTDITDELDLNKSDMQGFGVDYIYNHATLCIAMGRYQQALSELSHVEEHLTNLKGSIDDIVLTAETANNINDEALSVYAQRAYTLDQMGFFETARDMYKRCLDILNMKFNNGMSKMSTDMALLICVCEYNYTCLTKFDNKSLDIFSLMSVRTGSMLKLRMTKYQKHIFTANRIRLRLRALKKRKSTSGKPNSKTNSRKRLLIRQLKKHRNFPLLDLVKMENDEINVRKKMNNIVKFISARQSAFNQSALVHEAQRFLICLFIGIRPQLSLSLIKDLDFTPEQVLLISQRFSVKSKSTIRTSLEFLRRHVCIQPEEGFKTCYSLIIRMNILAISTTFILKFHQNSDVISTLELANLFKEYNSVWDKLNELRLLYPDNSSFGAYMTSELPSSPNSFNIVEHILRLKSIKDHLSDHKVCIHRGMLQSTRYTDKFSARSNAEILSRRMKNEMRLLDPEELLKVSVTQKEVIQPDQVVVAERDVNVESQGVMKEENKVDVEGIQNLDDAKLGKKYWKRHGHKTSSGAQNRSRRK